MKSLLHKSKIDDIKIKPKEGQRGLLCSNKPSFRCPSLRYNYVESADNLNKAFEILFEEVMRLRKTKNDYENNKINSDIFKSEYLEAGRTTNNSNPNRCS